MPITTDRTFTIGSNTKTYVALFLLKLQEQGVLSLNDTIGTWIKNKPYVNGKVTIRQLLNHTSGFGDFSYNPDFIAAIKADFNRVWQPEEMCQFFATPYFSTPGSGYDYFDQRLTVRKGWSDSLRLFMPLPHYMESTGGDSVSVISWPISSNIVAREAGVEENRPGMG